MFKEQKKFRLISNINFLESLLILNIVLMKMNTLTDSIVELANKNLHALYDLSVSLNQLSDVFDYYKSKILAVE